MTRANMTDAISSSVAENALCWCDGRSTRITRLRNPLDGLEPDADDAMKLRFYTDDASPPARRCPAVTATMRFVIAL